MKAKIEGFNLYIYNDMLTFTMQITAKDGYTYGFGGIRLYAEGYGDYAGSVIFGILRAVGVDSIGALRGVSIKIDVKDAMIIGIKGKGEWFYL